jgi:hypothetical protein
MKKFTILISVLFLSGCFLADMNPYLPEGWTHEFPTETDYEERHNDTLEKRTKWAPDKPIDVNTCSDCFHLGPLTYDEMILALHEV